MTWRTWIQTKCRSSWYPVLPVFLAVVTGLLGSLYSREIREAPPFIWLTSPTTSKYWSIGGFWVLLLLSAITYWPRQQALDDERREDAAEFLRRLSALPPADFLATFGDTFTTSYSALQNAQTAATRAECERAIQQVLASVAVLAQSFDSADHSLRYAANIMLFMERSAVEKDPSRADLLARLRFSGGAGIETMRGLLLVQPQLSATSLDPGPDPILGHFALPIPNDHERLIGGRMRYLALPGAPYAFVTGDASRFPDSMTMAQWCKDHGDFTEQVTEEIRNYFASAAGSYVRSLVSTAISRNGQQFAVLNIHRNTPGMLLEDDVAKRFVAMLRPYELLLGDLLSRWQQLEGK